jgi:hypothetical protein
MGWVVVLALSIGPDFDGIAVFELSTAEAFGGVPAFVGLAAFDLSAAVAFDFSFTCVPCLSKILLAAASAGQSARTTVANRSVRSMWASSMLQ